MPKRARFDGQACPGYGLRSLRETLVVSEGTHRSMQGNRGVDTQLEITVRRALWAAGVRGYRKNVSRLPGKPDLVFGHAKVAVFVHGCYWHQCPHCSRNREPKTNALYWRTKFAQNVERDARNRQALEAMGHRVVVIWECEVKADIDGCVEQVKVAIRR